MRIRIQSDSGHEFEYSGQTVGEPRVRRVNRPAQIDLTGLRNKEGQLTCPTCKKTTETLYFLQDKSIACYRCAQKAAKENGWH